MTLRSLCLTALVSSLAAPAFAADLVELRVFPAEVSLTTNRDFQSVVVQAVYSDGLTRDVTGQSEWKLADESLVRRDGCLLSPAKDGQTQLAISFEGKSQSIPVRVEKAGEGRPMSFKLDVMPIFMKAGCNTGSCHGAARGKDGFRLSLFGFDPDGDHFRITREQPGRRVDLAVPGASLIVEKCVGDVPHTGGKRFERDSDLCRTLVEWIAAGTPQDAADVARCDALELYPRQAVLDGEGTTQQMTVLARYSDGTTRDVTRLASFFTNNEVSASIDDQGLVTAGARGEAYIFARFSVHTVGSQFITLPKGVQYEPQPSQPVNYIDELVNAKHQKLRLHPSEVCSDEEFLRRVSIDLVGLLPTYEEYTAFLADSSPNKREKKIDELLARREFTDLWVAKWAEWLMMRSRNNIVSQKAIVLYYEWLVDQVSQNRPLDEMVQDLLYTSGGSFENPAVNFYEMERDRLKTAENVAQIFMGMRIQCAQCHNHPFDRWTQDDYYNFAAFFSQIGRKRGEDYREQVIYNNGGGEVRHPVTGQNAQPVFLGGNKPEIKPGQDRREIVANWLASPDNPYFASNFANRIWAHFFGIGIIEPVDDVRVSNPASNPELLDALAKRFTEYNYDFRRLVKDICLSQTYQRSTRRNESNETDEKNFAHQTVRRIKAESMLDVISQVTNTKDKFNGLPQGARAVQIADGATSTYFLTTFGRATRETACSCEVKMEPTLSQALHLLNGDTVNSKMQQGKLLDTLKKEGLEPLQIVERLYISTLTRKPTDEERAALAPLFAEGADANKALEDVYWALLNSREFLFNH
jgi:hypothetical protein